MQRELEPWEAPHPTEADYPGFSEVLRAFDHDLPSLGNPTVPTDAPTVELIDWSTLHDRGDAIVDGLLIPGRWTALAAAAKAGKTTLAMAASLAVSRGLDPFDGTRRDPVTVLYVDGEMGRFDLEQRLRELGVDSPVRLDRWHATDLPPRLDTPVGGQTLTATVTALSAAVVVIDGINGTVEGAEKDDTTWRAFFDYSIAPLKRAGVAILTGDNLGKDASLGPRGSSVKLDKPDGVLKLTRTDGGTKLEATHRRTSEYPSELNLSIDGLDGDQPIQYRRSMMSWSAGTSSVAKLLDELDVPLSLGRGKVRQLLTEAAKSSPDPSRFAVCNRDLADAIRYRKLEAARAETEAQN